MFSKLTTNSLIYLNFLDYIKKEVLWGRLTKR
jgi:hypothetical protein